jgi:VanZ family protein
MTAGNRAKLFSAAWIACWLVAFALTHIPIKTSRPTRVPHVDKAAHLLMYFAIVYLGGLRLHVRSKGPSTALLLCWACVYLVYGAFDEITQSFFGRESDFDDWVFDALGVGLATAALWRGFVPRAVQGYRGGKTNVTLD